MSSMHQYQSDRFAPGDKRPQRGFAMATAVFLLVVLAALGVAMLTFSTSQHASSGYDVLGSRAYQAARAGVEWALFQRLNPEVANPTNNPLAYCAGSAANVTNSFAMPAGNTLSPFTVTVTCIAATKVMNTNPITGVTTQVTIRTIQSTACNQPSGGACPNASPGADYVQRVVQVSIQEGF